MSRPDQAVACFRKGYNCAQAILQTYAPRYRLDRVKALKLSSGFGGGLARRGDICGAVTGACLVIGLARGRYRIQDVHRREQTYDLVEKLIREFKNRHHSIKCRTLIGCSLKTERDRVRALGRGVLKKRCPRFVRTAASVLERILP